MPLQTDGPISLNDISQEMGPSTGDQRLSEYYAGGGHTPSGCEGTRGPVPASGTITNGDFYGACAVDPTPYTELNCWGDGPAVSGIFATPANSMGYSFYCLETDPGVYSPGFGSYSGDRFLDNGSINEGFYAVVMLAEQNVSLFNLGMNILMYNDAFGSFYKYRFDITAYQNNGGTPGSFFNSWILYSASADADADIVARFSTNCGSTRTVRQLYWSLGTMGPGITPTDMYLNCKITRTSP